MSFQKVLVVIGLTALCLSVAEALSCYACTGNECVNSATIGNLKDCNGVDEKCYTIFSGYMPSQRGCWSELENAVQATCPGSDCVTCTTDNCNIYSRDEHQCVVCSSVVDEKCISDPASFVASQCVATTLDAATTQCYSRVIGSVTERGCVQSQGDLDSCDGTHCQTCAGTGCNNAEFPSGRQKCVTCDSLSCNAEKTTTSYCAVADDNCVTVQRSDGTYLKSCESSMSATDVQLCDSKLAGCSYCAGHECNKAELNLQTTRKCYTCQGTNCLRTAVEIETCRNSDDQCFSIFDGYNPVQRGCKSSLSEQDKLRCDDSEDVSCELCITDVCNLVSREDHQCQYCSSLVDSNCITAPNNVVQCPAPSTEVADDAQCYTRVIGRVTERGCLGSAVDALECRSSENCLMCALEDGNACNNGVFPTNRRKCVVGATANQYCPNPVDNCVQIFQNNSYTKTCQSSMSTEQASFCKANSNKCSFCAEDNCNQQNVAFDYLECLSCLSSNDLHCTTNPSAISTIKNCITCVTMLSSNSVVQRGCLADLTTEQSAQCSAGSTTCRTCTTNRCNGGMYPADRLACYTCLGGSCFSHDKISLEYCPNYQADDSCFVQLDSAGQLVRMGCKSSLSTTEVTTCSANPTQCRICSSAGCNDPARYLSTGSCIQCSSAHDYNCIGRASLLDAEPCNDPLNTQCYSRLVSTSTTERGCVNDLDASSKLRCTMGNDCSLCSNTRAKCNSIEYPTGQIKCHQCDSSTDASCKDAQSGTASYCSTYNSANSCYTIVQANGTTVRKCSTRSRNEECQGAERCEVCLFAGCNGRQSSDVMPYDGAATTTTTTAAPPQKASAERVMIANWLTLVLGVTAMITFAVRRPEVMW